VPADFGALAAMNQYAPGCCNTIESFLTIRAPSGLAGHFTTFECAVHGISDADVLTKIRKNIKAKFSPPETKHPGPKLFRRSFAFFDPREKKYAIQFMGADASVVRSSFRSLCSMKVLPNTVPQFAAYATLPSLYYLALVILYGFLFKILSYYPFGRKLLLAFPELFSFGVFSHNGPNEKQLRDTSFSMTIYSCGFEGRLPEVEHVDSQEISEGTLHREISAVSGSRIYNDSPKEGTAAVNNKKHVKVVIEGPEPGYVATPIIFVALAQSLLSERSKMPAGGVFTPAAAFHKCPEIFHRLNSAGIKITVYRLGGKKDK
jgi:hypothetical protein